MATTQHEDQTTQAQQDIEAMSFKEASIELEKIVRNLEGGELELEDALSNYSRGCMLLKSLKGRLENAEQKVQVLIDASAQPEETKDTTAAPSVAYIND